MLKRDGGTSVYRAKLLEREVVLKSWEVRTIGDRLKAFARMSRADRHWRGAEWLLQHGLETADPFALVEERRRGGRRIWLVMAALRGKTVLQHLADGDLSVRQEHAVARELARIRQVMIAAGRFNRDFKPSNLIVTDARPGRIRIATIDCVAIRRIPRGDDQAALRMDASLFIEPLGVGRPPRAALACRFLVSVYEASLSPRGVPESIVENVRATKPWKSSWARARDFIVAHGDPTPRINPLAPAAPVSRATST